MKLHPIPPWRRTVALALAATVLGTAAQRAAAAEEGYVFPRYTSAPQIERDCAALLSQQKNEEQRLQQLAAAEGANMLDALDALDAMQRRYEDTIAPMNLLAAVHPAKAIRDAADACDLRYQAFLSAFRQNPRIHALIKQVQPVDEIDRRMQRDQLEAFEDAGADLAADRQVRAQAINTEITRLTQLFDRSVLEDKTLVAYTAAELRGVPVAVWHAAKRDRQGRYLLSLDYATSGPVVARAISAGSRERMWRAVYRRGGEGNLVALAQLGQLRKEYASLFGLESYAEYALRRRMAQGVAEVQDFLAGIKQAVADRELSDLAALRAAKAQHLKLPPGEVAIQRWDRDYYIERARQAGYAVDQEQFRAYFPPEASLQFVFKLAEQLFGVKFTPVAQVLWHPDARSFNVIDIASRRLLGTLFVDLYPRPDKYGHAAVWPVRNVSTLAQRLPAAALVVNFNRHGLDLDELETLLHEFGHALHGLLSTTRYAGQGGLNVKIDFVEAPSQMLEDWVYDPRVLALFQQVCKGCKAVPAALIAKAERARHFGKGIYFARQHLYAVYDLALYAKDAPDPMALWSRMEGQTPLGYVPGSMFPASFNHVAGWYAAGYYSYLWSLVLAEDMRTVFAADRLDAAVGRRYRETVLANGGQVAPGELVQQFLGRPSDSRAFFTSLGRK
jgi:thimet oligopeptidase